MRQAKKFIYVQSCVFTLKEVSFEKSESSQESNFTYLFVCLVGGFCFCFFVVPHLQCPIQKKGEPKLTFESQPTVS